MIPEGVLIAFITGGMAVIGEIVVSARNTRELYARLDKQSEIQDQKLDAKIDRYIAATDVKIDELTREVRKHNNFAERVPVLEEKISVANHRIDDLEKVARTA